MKNYKFTSTIDSTNSELKRIQSIEALPEFFAVRTAFQSAGKGQVGNRWESQRGKNLLFSVLLFPHHIAIHEQFIISQMVSVAIVRILKQYGIESFIKWPNDIYVGDKKLGGILIENSLRGGRIEYTIIGVGLNVNQVEFKSNAPNPVSIFNILNKKLAVKTLFTSICSEISQLYSTSEFEMLSAEYKTYLYRSKGFYQFKYLEGEQFEAQIHSIAADGQLWLQKRDGELAGFYFKEVEFLLS